MPVDKLIQPRMGTAAQWTTANPVLATGELGYETDSKRWKRGDGSTAWNALAYGDTAARIGDATTAGRVLVTAADTTVQRTALTLNNVNNTADVDKPVSSAQQSAIDAVGAAAALKYTKPGGGIPSTDLSGGVQTSLGKLDTATQPAAVVLKADTSTAGFAFVVDEDAMTSNSATKLPTQQSVKAYVDSAVIAGGGGTVDTVVPGANIDVDNTNPANPIISVEPLTVADISGTTAQFNTALTDGDFLTRAGAEPVTNKTIDAALNTVTNIGSTALSADAVTTPKIGNGQVTLAKLSATGTKSAATVLFGDDTFKIPPVGLTELIPGPGIDIDTSDPVKPIVSAAPKGVLLIISSSASPAINTDLYASVDITDLTTDITSMSVNLMGNPVSLQSRLLIRFRSAAAQNIIWGPKFIDGAVVLPTDTEADKPLLVGLLYDGAETAWACEHVSTRLVAASPPATPPLFVGDYSTNNFGQWLYVQNAAYNGSAAGYTPSYRAAIVSDATYGEAARYEVRAGDDLSGSERSEVRGADATTGGQEGDLRWYRFQVKFDATFPSNHASLGWGLTNQFHGSASGSSPPVHWSVGATNGQWTLTAKPQSGPSQSGSAPIINVWSTPLGTAWHDIKMQILWSSNPAVGYMKLWHNGVAQTLLGGGTQYFNRTLIPGYGTYYKEGIYRTPMAPTDIVYHTGFVCGTTEASVGG